MRSERSASLMGGSDQTLPTMRMRMQRSQTLSNGARGLRT